MREQTLTKLAQLSRDGLAGDRMKAARFGLIWPLIAPRVADNMLDVGTTKTAAGLIPAALVAAMVGIPTLNAQLQRSQMEAYSRGRKQIINEYAPIMAAMMGPYGGLGMPTTMRNLVGLQGKGMV